LPLNKNSQLASGCFTQLSHLVARLIAPNPSPFTNTGTCTYIIGTTELAIIDPGPDDEAHFQSLMLAITNKKLTYILVTHTHKDHSPLARRLSQATGAPIIGCAPHFAARPLFRGEINRLEGSSDIHHAPDHILTDGEIVRGHGYDLEVVATPGHTMNHLAFALKQEKALFCGDHVMGWSTTIIAPPDGNMAAYIESLHTLRQRDDKIYYPGHGDKITNPQRLVRGIINHRKQRELSILTRIKAGDHSILDIVSHMYQHLTPALQGAAALSVFAHLEHMAVKGLVICEGEPMLNSVYNA
jgi:glyoxylase-like metal-dependent hydrolase (beta-lactamase superfamily II)